MLCTKLDHQAAIVKRWLALPVVLLFAFIVVDKPLSAQTEKSDTNQEPLVFRIVEAMPEYPGGMEALYKFLTENITNPENCRADSIQGTVYVRFIVNKEGNVRDIEVLRSPHEDLSKEAIRVVGLMPRWTPGRQRGKTVDEYFNLPIRFSLE